MADSVWNGFLRLSLVSCPIRLTPATSDGKHLKLDLLSARTGNPVTQQFVDGKTGDVVPGDALVKGYEFEKTRYVTLTDAELQKLGGGAGNIIDLEHFVPRDQIDRIYIESIYYLHPEGQLASDTMHALRLAMQRSGRAALGQVRIGERERPALIEPHRSGLMMSTLYTEDELVRASFPERKESDIPAEMIDIAEQIISRRAGDFDPKQLRDRFQDDLQKLVDEKAKNVPPAPPAANEARRTRSLRAPEPARVTEAPPAPKPEPPKPAPAPVAAKVEAPAPKPEPPKPAPRPEPPAAAAAPPAPKPAPPAAKVEPPAPKPAAPAAKPEPPPVAVAAPAPAAPPPEPKPAPAPRAVAPAPAPVEPPPAPAPATAPQPAGPRDVGAEILLHIMGLGDRRYVEAGWAGNPGSHRQIEALSVRPREGFAASSVEFRVFAQEGRATAWVSNGNYAGTRGRDLPLTGFAVRPTSELGERIDIVYEGSFFEGGVIGPMRNGELCVSPVSDDPLEAVRISIVERRE
jgi:DNA end-binding protein Ku